MSEPEVTVEETMGEVIKVDFRNKAVNIDPEEERISSSKLLHDCGDWEITIFGESGHRLTIRAIESGPIIVLKGSVVWLGVAMRAFQQVWIGGEELLGPFAAKNEAEREAAFACGFVERDGLWWRDAEETWPGGMVEEALEIENAFREEGTVI